MKKQEGGWIANYVSVLALLCSFVIGSLVLVNVGVHVYKNIAQNNAENFCLRTSLSYVATKVRQHDGAGDISVKEIEQVPVLVLTDEKDSDTYRTMIYCYDGALRELYQEEGMEYTLKDGQEIMELSDFYVEQKEGQLFVTVENQKEQEHMVLSLRSDKE